ncbi:ParB/RepB/Spo0J family partition protein [Gloeobacter kilaueensis]|uniref:ParB n=1 Tax=Gloeobacter kilaueensis (strain ATCC BAA-2537 / CCAP 1431/1 / ULC 316 / JS1) TaxID=1183438 RepID=U5QJZ0_GLOK1|nr:ParB/RepB/Spo0J family partition protein [Gloeobacter kilaueensis]AGY57919.1 ParB [Gloeobacter kilaueensis JS1]
MMSGKRDTARPEDRLRVVNAPRTEAAGCWLSVDAIRPCDSQPRRFFDPTAQQELIESVRLHGILQPLLVRPVDGGQYELVAGERRYRAARTVGLEKVPVLIRQLSNAEAIESALIENLQREELNPLEETEGILQLLALKLGQSEEQIVSLLYRIQNTARLKGTDNVMGSAEATAVQALFASLGKMTCDSFINNRLPLRNLPADLFRAVRQGKLAYTKARLLAQIKDRPRRERLLDQTLREDLSLSQLRQLVRLACAQPEPEPLFKRLAAVYRRVKKIDWQDPAKRARFEQLLGELDALVSNE